MLAYGASNTEFPHDTTANQFFTESQLESYRALGFHLMEQMMQSGRWQKRPLGAVSSQ